MILLHNRLNSTLLRIVNLQLLQTSTASTHTPRSIHRLLQTIILPPKDIISMLSQASWITGAENERLRAIRGPLGLVVEASGVPDNLEHELWDADWVS